MTKTRSADDLIVKSEAEKLGTPILDAPKPEAKQQEEVPPTESKGEVTSESKPDAQEAPKVEKEKPQEAPQKELEADSSDNAPDDEVDEYGTKVGKKKLYTEEEVQNMIRERFSRGQWANQNPTQQEQVKQAAENFTPDPESADNWEVQLETFIEKTVNKLSNKSQEEEWKRQEAQKQADFEIKFSEGMGKYKDFVPTVQGKPISAAMMMATRSMKDPAAFIYAACKQHPKEIERIAQIGDSYAQSVEIGRLEERMKKARNVTSAPKPATKVSGDIMDDKPKRDIDSLISIHAKSKVR